MEEEPLVEMEVGCPYCGEPVTTLVDASAGDTSYIEDCPVCCAPMEVAVQWPSAGGPPTVIVARDDD